jgi:hypothetical protein
MRRSWQVILPLIASAAVLCAGVAHATTNAPTATSPDCRDIKFIGVRGSGDTSSDLGAIATALSSSLAAKARAAGLSYDGYGVPYTAVGINWYKLIPGAPGVILLGQYRLSVRDGHNKLYGFIHEQVHDCPTEKLAVLGYSQGAQVVGDIFSKGLGRLTSTELAHVKAVVLVADPRFNSQERYDHGSFRNGRNGLLGARSPADLTSVSNRLGAWCRKDDLICQGPGTTGNHAQSNYLADYQGAIVSFLSDHLGLTKAAPPPFLGLSWAFNSHGSGFGQVKPRGISTGGDPTGAVHSISWSDWGKPKAIGNGKAYWVWPGLSVASGSVLLQARVVAFDLGPCADGGVAYRKVSWYFPERGETFDPKQSFDICDTDPGVSPAPTLTDCGSLAIQNPAGRATDIQVTDVGCAAARAVISTSHAAAFVQAEKKFRVGVYYCGTEGPLVGTSSFECGYGSRVILWSMPA